MKKAVEKMTRDWPKKPGSLSKDDYRRNTVEVMAALARKSCREEHTRSAEDDHFCGYVRIDGLLTHCLREWPDPRGRERR